MRYGTGFCVSLEPELFIDTVRFEDFYHNFCAFRSLIANVGFQIRDWNLIGRSNLILVQPISRKSSEFPPSSQASRGFERLGQNRPLNIDESLQRAYPDAFRNSEVQAVVSPYSSAANSMHHSPPRWLGRKSNLPLILQCSTLATFALA